MNTKEIANKLIDSYGESLISLISYGPENTHFLILTNTGGIGVFQAHQKALGRLCKNHQFTIMTEQEFKNAVDVFPIEFLDIQSHHTCHYGHNIIQDISIQLTNLRHECEYTLRSHILKLRAALLTPKPNYTALIEESFPMIKATLTCIFRLHEQPIPDSDWINNLSKLTQTDLSPLEKANTPKAITQSDFQAYLDTLSTLTRHVDTH